MQVLGSAVWLWMHDRQHGSHTLRDVEHRLLAPIEAGQFIVARQADAPAHPLALLLFARFDARSEARYLADPALKIAYRDWRSGDRIWLIDWVAPFGHGLALRRPLAAFLAGRRVSHLCRSGRRIFVSDEEEAQWPSGQKAAPKLVSALG
ncbi:MAG: toxin-activating lysine-acyltransferase [Hydrogenophaga sp.]